VLAQMVAQSIAESVSHCILCVNNLIRELKPDVQVVVGGYDPTLMTEVP